MRKSLLFGAMLLIASCTVQKEEEFESPLQHRYHATVEGPVDAETRVYADSRLRVHWNEGDHISIFERTTYNQEYEFLGDNGDTAGDFDPVESSGYHTGGDIEDGHVYAIYPYDKKNKCDYEGKLTVTFPSAQHYKKDSFGIGANIMVARTNTMDLNFMHLGGYRTFKLYGEGVSVSSIRIESNGPEFLSGRTDVIIGSDGKPAVSFIESETNSKSIELVCDTPVALGGTAAEAVEFWFVLPPCTLTQGFTVTITDNNGGVFTKATSNSIEIKSGVKKSMSAFEVVPVIAVSGVELDQTEATITVGNTATLTATVLPENATNKVLFWSSSDETVATVDENGVVTAVAAGTATITVTTEDGDKTASCMVTVTPVKVSSVTISPTSANVSVGSTVTLTPTVTPSNAADKSVTWSSSDTDVATVNSSGVVSGITAGTATITATAKDGSGVSGSCTVIVNNVPVSSVVLNKTSLSLINGTSEKLIATVNPDNATNKTVTWTSSNTGVATVGSDGTVLAKSAGTATITATADGQSASCIVSVVIPVTSIRIYSRNQQAETTSLSMYRGDTDNLTIVCYPENATNKNEYTSYSNQYWSTGYTYITVVSGSLRIDEDCPTNITKTLTVSVKGLSATCSITVLDANPSPVNLGLSVNWANTNLYAESQTESGRYFTWTEATRHNGSSQDEAQYATDGAWRLPTKAEIQELIDYCTITSTTVNGISGVRFTSKANTNNSIFLPDVGGYQYGVFVPFSEMGAFYWSSTLDGQTSCGYRLSWWDDHIPSIVAGGGTEYQFVIRPVSTTVNQIEVTSVSLNKTSASINVGATVSLTATISPGNASDKTVTWTTTNSSVATVSNSGVVTGIAPGNATIRATSGGKTASCYVTVSKIAVTSVTLNASTLSLLVGNNSTLTATVAPANATYPTVTWSSTNTSVATVSSTGKVTAVGPGSTTIKATADGKTALCTVTVTQLVTSISLNKTTTTLRIGDSETLYPTVNPSNASNRTLSWSSSAPTIASVASGKITAKATGTAVITAAATDGSGLSASCTVTVIGSGKQFPTNGTFDEDAYITYVSNFKVEWSGDNEYIYRSVIPCGKSGTKVEMKFQVDQTIWTNGGSDSGSQVYLGGGFRMTNQYLYFGSSKTGSLSSGEYLIRWNGSGVAFNSIITLTAELVGDEISSTINGVTGYQDEIRTNSWSFPYLFSDYDKDYDEGWTYDYIAGVPNGARLYYVKIWDSNNQLVYFGYAAKKLNSSTGNEEYCWYCPATNTCTFADNHKSAREPFGGGID